MYRLEGKKTDSEQSGVLQPEFGMPLDFNKSANDEGMASSASNRAQGLVRLQTNHRASRASARNTILPNPPKSPNPLPDFDPTNAATSADFLEALDRLKEDLTRSFESSLGVHIKPTRGAYHKPYLSAFDFVKAPVGWKVPDFQKFSGDDSKSIMEHISMFLAQMGEASTLEYMLIRNFALSLTGTAFA